MQPQARKAKGRVIVTWVKIALHLSLPQLQYVRACVSERPYCFPLCYTNGGFTDLVSAQTLRHLVDTHTHTRPHTYTLCHDQNRSAKKEQVSL